MDGWLGCWAFTLSQRILVLAAGPESQMWSAHTLVAVVNVVFVVGTPPPKTTWTLLTLDLQEPKTPEYRQGKSTACSSYAVTYSCHNSFPDPI